MTGYKQILLYFMLFKAGMSQSNDWSNCSRTCGTGTSHRPIPCQGTNCTEAEREYRLCTLKECPDDYVDFRSEQCQKYGEKLVSFNDTSNPCKLMCMLPGEKPIEKATAVDGTPCLSGGICVDGMCIPVGCNGILGSEKKIDECGRCGPTNGICLQVPCIINHNISTNGYAINVPVGSTKINITWGSSCNISEFSGPVNVSDKELTAAGPLEEKITVEINCQQADITCGYHTPLYEITKYYNGTSINGEKNYQWIVGNEFTACSQTCGIGAQISRIYCQNVETKMTVELSFCDNLSTEHLDTRIRKCKMPSCPNEWQVTDWSPCSKSCNGGHRSRNVTCVQTIDALANPIIKNETQCLENKPRSLESCNHHHCYNHWHKGPWSACSSACGNGTRTRKITCINAHGIETETSSCDLLTKPKEEEKCIGEMCTYKWIASDWSNCSVDCGLGYEMRSVYCQYIMKKIRVDDSLCLQSMKPASVMQCQRSCSTNQWLVERWGPCDAEKCNYKGFMHRNYFCFINGTKGSYFDHEKCDNSTEPDRVKECYKTEGCKPHWDPLPWGECDKTCDGIRVRGLVCKLGNKVVDVEECPNIKPSVIEQCNAKITCPPPPVVTCEPEPFCESFLPYLSTPGVLELCKEHCCDLCESD